MVEFLCFSDDFMCRYIRRSNILFPVSSIQNSHVQTKALAVIQYS